MKINLLIFLLILPLALGQTPKNVQKTTGTNAITEDLAFPSGRTLTIKTGGSLTVESGVTLALPGVLDAGFITKTASGTLTNEFALGSLATGILKNTTTTGVPTIAAAGIDYVSPGSFTGSGLTMATARLLGRTTASTGAAEEITVGAGLTLISGELAASGGGVGGSTGSIDNALIRADGTGGGTVQSSNVTIADSGTALVFSAGGGITAGGTNENVTLTPSGTGHVRAVNRLYVGEGSLAYAGLQSLIMAREGNDFGGALGVHAGANATNNFAWTFQRSRGTLASPTAVQSGDRIGQFTFSGYHGSGFSNSATIFVDAAETFGTNRGVVMDFETVPTGSPTRTLAMRIDGSQNVLARNGLNVGGGSIGGGTTIARILSASTSLDYGSISSGAEATLTITVTGASTTNTPTVFLGFSAAMEDGIVVKQAWVSATNTVSVRVRNVSGGSIDPASVTVRAMVSQF